MNRLLTSEEFDEQVRLAIRHTERLLAVCAMPPHIHQLDHHGDCACGAHFIIDTVKRLGRISSE